MGPNWIRGVNGALAESQAARRGKVYAQIALGDLHVHRALTRAISTYLSVLRKVGQWNFDFHNCTIAV